MVLWRLEAANMPDDELARAESQLAPYGIAIHVHSECVKINTTETDSRSRTGPPLASKQALRRRAARRHLPRSMAAYRAAANMQVQPAKERAFGIDVPGVGGAVGNPRSHSRRFCQRQRETVEVMEVRMHHIIWPVLAQNAVETARVPQRIRW